MAYNFTVKTYILECIKHFRKEFSTQVFFGFNASQTRSLWWVATPGFNSEKKPIFEPKCTGAVAFILCIQAVFTA